MSPVRRALPGLLGLLLLAGCPERKSVIAKPDDAPPSEPSEVDVLGLCEAGCDKLTRCVPDLALDADAAPDDIAARLADECSSACTSFATPHPTVPGAALRLELARESSLALEGCLALDSCNAYWGCVSSDAVRPWLAAVAPVGERSCENLCSQASACAIAKVCESSDKERERERDKDRDATSSADPLCQTDGTRRDELEESCLLQCNATPSEGEARHELLGCLDHVSCGGMLECLDRWAETDYPHERGPMPGVSQTCDDFCTRAIECGAQAQGIELSSDEIAALREIMTSTWVECAVQCEKDMQRGEAQKQTFEQCTATSDCAGFLTCAAGA